MYKAKQSVGEFNPGDVVDGLEASDIERLLSIGAIEEVEAESEVKKTVPTKTAKK